MRVFILSLCLIFVSAEPKIYLKEEFDSESYTDRWAESTHKGSDQGKFKWTAGKFYNDAEKDKGIQTSQDAKFYGILTKFEPFSNDGKTLVVQFQVKHEQSIDCGGGYIKLVGPDVEAKSFHGDSPYKIMFGPDICGSSTKKVHVIFNYKGKNLLIKRDITCKDDELTHLYTLIVKPDNTYSVLIDNEQVQSGNLEDDWDFLQPKKIKDPAAKKPADWVDNAMIDDPNDKKPEDYDKPKTIPDPKAKKPDDWDSEMDGEWEAPQIDNPEYKGEWKPKQIDNPDYKGPWIHPEIDNPDYQPDDKLYLQTDIAGAGFDLWQVKSGTIFDNILITDDPEYAKQYAEETFKKTVEGEKKMKEKQDEEQRKKDEEEAKKQKEEEDNKKKEEGKDKEEEKSDDKEDKDDDSDKTEDETKKDEL